MSYGALQKAGKVKNAAEQFHCIQRKAAPIVFFDTEAFGGIQTKAF